MIDFAICYRANIKKNKARITELQKELPSDSVPLSDITDSVQYERWAERELKKQESYRVVASSKHLSNEEKEKLFRLMDEYYSGSSP